MADSATSVVDPYGFERPENFDARTHEEFMAEYLGVLARRAGRWSRYMHGRKRVSKSAKLKRFVRKGVPSEHRPLVWLCVSGADRHLKSHPGLYQQLLEGPHSSHLIELINTDVPRTFPNNIYFQGPTSSAQQNALSNVLVAVAHNNPDIGYCQGLNFIAGLLLLVVKDEEQTFSLVSTLLNNILPDYYTVDMIGLKVDCEVLGELVRQRDPAVHRAMTLYGCPWPLIATRWFICLYVDVVPTETVLRVWDCLFSEGSVVLLRVGLSIVLQHSDAVLRCRSTAEILDVFRRVPTSPHVTRCHEFMQSVFRDIRPFPESQIAQLRTECRQRISPSTSS